MSFASFGTTEEEEDRERSRPGNEGASQRDDVFGAGPAARTKARCHAAPAREAFIASFLMERSEPAVIRPARKKRTVRFRAPYNRVGGPVAHPRFLVDVPGVIADPSSSRLVARGRFRGEPGMRTPPPADGYGFVRWGFVFAFRKSAPDFTTRTRISYAFKHFFKTIIK